MLSILSVTQLAKSVLEMFEARGKMPTEATFKTRDNMPTEAN